MASSQFPFDENRKVPATLEQFVQYQILETIRRQPEPKALDPQLLLVCGRRAAEIKARLPQYQNSRKDFAQLTAMRHVLLWRTFPFNDLPVEIVSNIFRYAVWSSANSPEGILLRFRLTWVCRRWRNIATCDQTLWNTIWFKDAKVGYQLSKLYFERAGTTTLDLRIEDDSKTRLIQDQPMTGDDMERVLDIIMSKSSQIRMIIVVVELWPPVLVLLDRLHRTSQSLQQLERVEVHRTGRPYQWDGPHYPLGDYEHALTLCNGRTERVNFLCLNGVHIDWETSYITNLVNLDLRRMPPELGPSLERFRCVLESSPKLKKLSLDGAGPIMPTGWATHSYPPVFLPRLETLILGDCAVTYAIFCAGIIHAPGVRELIVLNFRGPDHTPVLQALTGKFPELLIISVFSLDIRKSPWSRRIVVRWLLSIPKIKFMRVGMMKATLMAHFFLDGRLHIDDDIPLTLTPEEENAILANGSRIILCPELEAFEGQHIDVDTMVQFIYGRKKFGVPLRKLYIHQNWLQDMTPDEKNKIQEQGYEHDFIDVTVPMSTTPYERSLWKQLRGG
ncbi:hypothetical protein F5148DRAFT_849456 [Russula earlei]|uniref:Uncharacterized protein n=1 Tax=Russula earlei TaxID=71964 RepID=A0ACC0ULT6_9AGAM|nr:hypothetical protein F5148DRAFT_849456 [Russula earlei]